MASNGCRLALAWVGMGDGRRQAKMHLIVRVLPVYNKVNISMRPRADT